MRADQVAQVENVGQTHGDNRQSSFALHPLKICDCGPSEISFEAGARFGNRNEAPDGDYYNAVTSARSVSTICYLVIVVSERIHRTCIRRGRRL